MWKACLPTRSYLEDASNSKKIRKHVTRLVVLEVYLINEVEAKAKVGK